MREGWPSLTAAIVAFGRGVGLADELRDTEAASLAPPPLRRALGAIRGRPALRVAARALSLGLVDHATLRMVAIDTAVEDAVAEGAKQLVILGAGLDARAFRMHALGDVHVFEVDHPSTQAYKRRHVAGRKPRSGAHTFVPVDFERDSLAERLDESGHDPATPTCWIWEGVTMYLRPEAVRGTLAVVGDRSAARSVLSATYVRPSYAPARFRPVVNAAFATLGEPLLGAVETAELEAQLGEVGFALRSDTSTRDWARHHAPAFVPPSPFGGERLAIAVKRT